MFRKKLIEKKSKKTDGGFKWRCNEILRIEAFTDAVFAFAVTLLIVSLEVPETFDELLHTMSGFLAFAFSFMILFQIWYSNHIFFRRYGLQDLMTTILNGALIFLVLFYVYPLKFLFKLLLQIGGEHTKQIITQEQLPLLMIIYGVGFASIYLILALMYSHAYKKKEELMLSPKEIFDTKTKIYAYLINVIIPLSTVIAVFILPQNKAGLSGLIYFMIGPAFAVYYSARGSKMRKQFGI